MLAANLDFDAIPYADTPPMDRLGLTDAQRLQRMSGMSATDIVKISGLAPGYMGGPFGVYGAKTGEAPLEEATPGEDVQRGVFLEPSIRGWYAHQTGRAVQLPGTLQSPEHPLIFATPDGISHHPEDPAGTRRILEIKAPRYGFDWDEETAPAHYRIQVQVQMGVTGIREADLVALVDGGLRIYPQRFNPGLYADLVAMAMRFWHDHVLAKVPPPPDGTEACSDWLARRHPAELTEDLAPADSAALAWLARYRDASDALKAAEADKREARNHLVALVGDHAGLCDADGNKLVTYKKTRDTEAVDHRALCAALSPRTLNRYRTTKVGHRSIKVY